MLACLEGCGLEEVEGVGLTTIGQRDLDDFVVSGIVFRLYYCLYGFERRVVIRLDGA